MADATLARANLKPTGKDEDQEPNRRQNYRAVHAGACFDRLIDELRTKTAKIGVVGLGYVGLPLVGLYLQKGFSVLGLDTDTGKIEALKGGRSYIEYIDGKPLRDAFERGSFMPSSDFSLAAEADAIIICVPTPLNKHREPDLSYVVNSMSDLQPFLRSGQVISLESTTYPGTTSEVLRPSIEAGDLRVGKDVFLVYSPEREDPNNPNYTTKNIPKICGGETERCLEVGRALYEGVVDTVVAVSSTRTAEMTKILENTFRAVNIALVNELKVVAERMGGVDIFEVIRAASTKPFGFMPFYPGPGLGGHCIPIDPFYLTWKAREYGVSTKFIELAGEVNTAMPGYVIDKVVSALNEQGKSVKRSRILLLGLAYKKNVDDTRESPSLELLVRLQAMGAEVEYSDPHVPKIPKLRRFTFDMQSVPLTPERIATYDLVLVVTDHDAFDWRTIAANAQAIVDTRGKYEPLSGCIYRA